MGAGLTSLSAGPPASEAPWGLISLEAEGRRAL